MQLHTKSFVELNSETLMNYRQTDEYCNINDAGSTKHSFIITLQYTIGIEYREF